MIKRIMALFIAAMITISFLPIATHAASKSSLSSEETNNIIMTGIVHGDLLGRGTFERLTFGLSQKYPKTATHGSEDSYVGLITSKYTFDKKGRIISVSNEWEETTDPADGFDAGYVVKYEYDEDGRCVSSRTLNVLTEEEAYKQVPKYLTDPSAVKQLPYALVYEYVQNSGANICALKYDDLDRITDINIQGTYDGEFYDVQESYHFTYKNGFLVKVKRDYYSSTNELGITYNKDGVPVQFTVVSSSKDRKSSTTYKTTYDKSGRLTRIKGEDLDIKYAY